MKIKIKEAQDLATKILVSHGFSQEEAKYCVLNCLEGELTEKKTHGFVRIPKLIKFVNDKRVIVGGEDIEVIKETPVSILVDGKKKTGLYVINKALELGIQKVKSSGMVAVGVTNNALISGMIGQYARVATEQDLIYIGFHNSISAIAPFGSAKAIVGTNPITVGIPINDLPIILDMSSSKITYGEVLLALSEKRELESNVVIDKDGHPSTNPDDAFEGALLPMADHKGSGLAIVIELLAGALTGSLVGNNITGGWGSFFILIDPSIIRDINEFKTDAESLIKELKNSPKMDGFDEIYYPGERSQKKRLEALRSGEFELSDEIYNELIEL